MVSFGFCCKSHYRSQFVSDVPGLQKLTTKARESPSSSSCSPITSSRRSNRLVVVSSGEKPSEEEKSRTTERRTFLTLEEAGLVEVSGLSTHERFLCRLTISSLNLLRVISEQEGCPIEELNAGRVCDWFVKDKLKREQDIDSAVLRWDDSEIQF